jgi:diadenosine tetraphosphate (Ap4A) HIT family hydrolase
MFELHPRLKAGCMPVGRFPLCLLLMKNDSNYPWFILVPEREGIEEIFQLSQEDQTRLILESSQLSAHLSTAFSADRMNVAALGNEVPQLHVHHVVRYATDPAWPGPVWGKVAARPYKAEEAKRTMAIVSEAIGGMFTATE